MSEEYTPNIRLYVDKELAVNASIELDKAQSHYLVSVMRQKPGMQLELFNGRDGSFVAVIEQADRKAVQLRCSSHYSAQISSPDIWFVFAPIKRTRLDFMAQKATELGAGLIWPVFTDYTQVSRVNTDRLEANAIEAAEQSGRMDIPEIRPCEKLASVLCDWPSDRHLIFCDELAAGQNSPAQTLSALKQNAGASLKAAILIGPEGGFSAAEREMLLNMDCTYTLSLGPRILRADTAGLSALTLVQAFCSDWVENTS